MVKADRHSQMYGKAHRRLRAQWKVKVDAGGVRCWRCRLPIEPGSRWHLDHLPGTVDQYAGPAHPRCNEVGILPGQPIVAHTPPPGNRPGRPTAEDRLHRSLPPGPDRGIASPAGHRPRGNAEREMADEGAPTEGPHMAGPHRRDGRNLSQYWPGACECRPGEAERDAAYRAYLNEAHRRGVEAVATGRLDEYFAWLDEQEAEHYPGNVRTTT